MPKTKGRGRSGGRQTPAGRSRPAPPWDAVDTALRRAGLLTELPAPGPEATDDIAPLAIPGEPVSETIIRDRR